MSHDTAIVWIREDRRLRDNPALFAAREFQTIIPVYIYEEDHRQDWQMGAAKKWWLHHSLKQFATALTQENLPLLIAKGHPENVFAELLSHLSPAAVFWNRRYDPEGMAIDTKIKSNLQQQKINVESFPGNVLNEPWLNCKADKSPYQVYTPFWKKVLENRENIAAPLPKPQFAPQKKRKVASLSIDELDLLPTIHWYEGMATTWTPGEEAGRTQLRSFIKNKSRSYNEQRDLPAIAGTSQLSPYLANGEITPRQIWAALSSEFGDLGKVKDKNIEQYAKEVVWREFAYHLLFHFPHTCTEPLREAFKKFPWQDSQDMLTLWQKGQTGYPIVDAGMRQLWQTGWMHNRVRMIVASFLVKHLRQHWLHGARWFWDTLVDADLAANTLGWQWAAGCGADAAPYFRIFNPITQGEKFDGKGQYTLQYCPELRGLAVKNLFKPWEQHPTPTNYPPPAVTHTKARIQALQAFEKIKG